MDAVWFIEDGEEARRQQDWFSHIGAGQNMRTAEVPTELSKKMAHHFLQAPEHYTIEEALRYGQIKGQGGGDDLAGVASIWRARISAIRNSKTSSGASNEPADHLIDPHRRPGLGGSQLEQGRQVLRVGAEEKPGAEVMELRAVRLRYAAV